MSNEIVDSIRRIADRVDAEAKEPIEQLKRIGNTRSISYVNNRGDVSNSSSSTADDIEDTLSTPNAETPIGDTGGTGGRHGSPDPNDDPTTDPEGGAIIEGDIKTVYGDSIKWSTWGSVSGTTRGTSDVVCFNTHPLGEGVEFIAPDGWDSPDAGPVDPSWTEGEYWRAPVDSYVGYGASAAQAVSSLVEQHPNIDSGFVVSSNPGSNTGIAEFHVISTDADIQIIIFQDPCGGHPTGADGACAATPEDPPREETQPSTGCCEVTWVEAESIYRGHPNDSDCSASQITGTSSPEICSIIDPSSCYRFDRLASGGSKITPVDTDGFIVPNSIIKETDSTGKVVGFYDSALYNIIE